MAEKLAVCLYFDADNDLEKYIVNNVMDAMDADLSSGNLDIYIYLDRSDEHGSYQEEHENPSGEKTVGFDKYLTDAGNNPWAVTVEGKTTIANKACYLKIYYDEGLCKNVLTVKQELGKKDSGSKATLTAFLDWCATECKDATKKILEMSDHGSGFERSFSDDTEKSGLLPQAVADAIKASKWQSVDVLMDDACLMANAEGTSTLNGAATYMVASEDLIDGPGCAYAAMLTALSKLDPNKSDNYSAKALADLLVSCNDTAPGRAKTGAATLASLNVNTTQKTAMDTFAKASANFTDTDWSK